jgi:LmbE family N-acetylglucosaminyl deacetylase
MAAMFVQRASEMVVNFATTNSDAGELLLRATAPPGSSASMPRAMVIVAHPDDEVINVGGRMGRFGDAFFIHVTDGAPRNEEDSKAHGFSSLEDYKSARASELSKMFATAGLESVRHACIGVPDQEATFHLIDLTRELKRRIAQFEPEVIFTHPYEGGHPDHDACAFSVHHSVALVKAERGLEPLILESPFYNAGSGGRDGGAFLELPEGTTEIVYELSAEERTRKQALMACFATQQETLKFFQCDTERYRVAPGYDFRRTPHSGKVFYDNFSWGMTSERFCRVAGEAESELHGESTLMR